jgi:hypothetical protein
MEVMEREGRGGGGSEGRIRQLHLALLWVEFQYRKTRSYPDTYLRLFLGSPLKTNKRKLKDSCIVCILISRFTRNISLFHYSNSGRNKVSFLFKWKVSLSRVKSIANQSFLGEAGLAPDSRAGGAGDKRKKDSDSDRTICMRHREEKSSLWLHHRWGSPISWYLPVTAQDHPREKRIWEGGQAEVLPLKGASFSRHI